MERTAHRDGCGSSRCDSGGDWVGAASGLLRPIVLGGLLFASLLVLFGEPSASEFIYFNF
jgi:hypothetical protein